MKSLGWKYFELLHYNKVYNITNTKWKQVAQYFRFKMMLMVSLLPMKEIL